jgi:hypothetical protein
MHTKSELEFRKYLNKQMNGLWLMTWHEDGLVNPGVPDVSYVMNGNCETGWLELKAIEGADKNGNYKFTLEPSQHRWIDAHHDRVPVHILCATDAVCWLVPGDLHRELFKAQSHKQLSEFSVGFQREQLRYILYDQLTLSTDRRRCGLFGI